MHTIIDTAFDLDEDDLVADRGEAPATAIIGDRDLRLLLRENRLALAILSTTPVPVEATTACYDVSLACVVHAHPRCRFRWSRLSIDLTTSVGATIADMAPREVIDDSPVQLTTTVGVGLKFSILHEALGAEIKPELARSRTVYFPQILASGSGFRRGYWDFLARGEQYLHADRALRLLVTAPEGAPLQARFTLRARVTMKGLAGYIPLVGREGGIEGTHRLDSGS